LSRAPGLELSFDQSHDFVRGKGVGIERERRVGGVAEQMDPGTSGIESFPIGELDTQRLAVSFELAHFGPEDDSQPDQSGVMPQPIFGDYDAALGHQPKQEEPAGTAHEHEQGCYQQPHPGATGFDDRNP
jgi:hypothetical protein